MRMHLLAAPWLFLVGCFTGASAEVWNDGGLGSGTQWDLVVYEVADAMAVEAADGGDGDWDTMLAPDAGLHPGFTVTPRPDEGGDGDGDAPVDPVGGDGGLTYGAVCSGPDDCASGYCAAGLCAVGPDCVPAADDATCDGVDDDCDGRTDEDYAPVTCGAPACLPGYTGCDGGEVSCHGEVCQ